jgi:predicted ferric reductase
MNNPQFWWHLSRASGIVTWGIFTATCIWGILLSTRMLKPYDRPAWLLDLHKWLGALTMFGIGIHMAAIVGDSYVHFGTADVFVPFASSWKSSAVAWGIIAFYLTAAVQLSSLVMKKIPKKLWKYIHLTSCVSFVLICVHSIAAGTDRANRFFQAFAVAIITLMVGATSIRVIYAGKPRTRVVLSQQESPQ